MIIRVLVQETLTVQKTVLVQVDTDADAGVIEERAKTAALEHDIEHDDHGWEVVSSLSIDCSILS